MADGGRTTSATSSATADRDALQRSAAGSRRSRSPRWQPIRERDRAFLNEYLQFGYMHHVIAAEALRGAYERADAVATRMREQVERVDRPTATAMAVRLNDGARVQTVVVARLLSEFASAIEDLAALIHAVRHRARRGILVEYLEAEVPACADVLDLLLAQRDRGLSALLKLPALESIGPRLDAEALKGLEHDYASLGDALAQIAVMYRDEGPQGTITNVSSVAQDEVAIVLEIIEPGQPVAARPGGLLARAHNKIKHRFAVIEDIVALGPAAGGQVLYTRYPRGQFGVMRLVYNITQVALAGAEIAALLIAIDHVKTGTGGERQAAKRTSTHVPSDSLGQ